MSPVRIKVIDKKKLYIKWEDDLPAGQAGSESIIALEKMRKLCPCATCLTEREKQSKTYIPILNENQVQIAKINQVGSYAVSVIWKDGHSTGIYEYAFLKKLAQD